MVMQKRKITGVLEVFGSVLAIAYAMLIATNTGTEVLGFILLLISALLFAGWGIFDKRWAFVVLQAFYVAAAVIGLIRWG